MRRPAPHGARRTPGRGHLTWGSACRAAFAARSSSSAAGVLTGTVMPPTPPNGHQFGQIGLMVAVAAMKSAICPTHPAATQPCPTCNGKGWTSVRYPHQGPLDEYPA